MEWLSREENSYYGSIRSHLSALLPGAKIYTGLVITFEGKIMRAIGLNDRTYFIDKLFSPNASEKEIADGIYKTYIESTIGSRNNEDIRTRVI